MWSRSIPVAAKSDGGRTDFDVLHLPSPASVLGVVTVQVTAVHISLLLWWVPKSALE